LFIRGWEVEGLCLVEGDWNFADAACYRYGAANTDFWVDGEKDIVVVMTGNFFPWNDEEWVKFVAGVEGIIYEGLEG
jgi:hypothetical protein